MEPGEEAGEVKGRTCVRSGRCCLTNPGWFAPGEAERAAEWLGMTMGDFVNRFLVIDHLDIDRGRVEVFAPAKLDDEGRPVEEPGSKTSDVYDHTPGACIFYDEEESACSIYGARPLECRRYSCIHPPEWNISREEIAELWLAHWARERERAADDGVDRAAGASPGTGSVLPDI